MFPNLITTYCLLSPYPLILNKEGYLRLISSTLLSQLWARQESNLQPAAWRITALFQLGYIFKQLIVITIIDFDRWICYYSEYNLIMQI